MTPEDAAAALTATPGPLDDVVADLPGAPGLYAWWRPADVLPALGGAPHPGADLRLLDLGAATMLRNRIRRQDLYRSGVSPLRRVLAGVLLDELALAPTWAADVVLPTADESRLGAWMRPRLRLTWVGTDLGADRPDDRARLLEGTRGALGEPATAGEAARAAQDRYVAAAGQKAAREPGVPFRRP